MATNVLDSHFGTGPAKSLHRHVVLRSSGISGKGLFATQFIPAGEVIWEERAADIERILSWQQLQELSPEDYQLFLNFGYQIGEDEFSGPSAASEAEDDWAHFQNHR